MALPAISILSTECGTPNPSMTGVVVVNSCPESITNPVVLPAEYIVITGSGAMNKFYTLNFSNMMVTTFSLVNLGVQGFSVIITPPQSLGFLFI
jgi:hypothetical protein